MQVTLIGVVGERLTMAMQSNSPALVCSAARAAGEVITLLRYVPRLHCDIYAVGDKPQSINAVCT